MQSGKLDAARKREVPALIPFDTKAAGANSHEPASELKSAAAIDELWQQFREYELQAGDLQRRLTDAQSATVGREWLRVGQARKIGFGFAGAAFLVFGGIALVALT